MKSVCQLTLTGILSTIFYDSHTNTKTRWQEWLFNSVLCDFSLEKTLNVKCADCGCFPSDCQQSLSPKDCLKCTWDECCCWSSIKGTVQEWLFNNVLCNFRNEKLKLSCNNYCNTDCRYYYWNQPYCSHLCSCKN